MIKKGFLFLKPFSTLINFKERIGQISHSKLSNGVTVVTESMTFPSQKDFGILIDVGTRDEDQSNSGLLNVLKQNYFKTTESPNGVNNLEQLHQLGSNLEFDYDQESMMFKASASGDNYEQLFDIMLKCALQKRSHIFQYQIDQEIPEDLDFYDFDNSILMQAFGKHNLGLPITGLNENINKLNATQMDNFFKEQIQPNKIYIYGGLEDHNQFAQMVERKMSQIQFQPSNIQRQLSQYQGGQKLIEDEKEDLKVGIFFQGANWDQKALILFNIIEKILGSTASFSTGGPGKGMHSRTSQQMLNRYYYFNSADCFNIHFMDNGLFGMKTTGPYSAGKDMIKTMCEKLKEMTHKITDEELNRNKNIFKSHIFQVLERKQCRLEESTKNIKMLGDVYIQNYENIVDSITSQQINDTLKKIFKTEPTYIVQGKDASKMPQIKEIKRFMS